MSLIRANSLAPKPWTDVFTDDSCIDRRECKRTVPMKVLALGVGRTGTTSLHLALERLGYIKCYSMVCASVENPPDCLMWHDALSAKYDGSGEFGREQWDQLLGHCQAVCAWPACAFAKELIEAYPDAKVILTTRDVDSWHASVMKTVYWRATDPEHRLVSYFSWAAGMYYPMLNKFFEAFFRGDFPNKGKQVYLDHVDMVRQLVPSTHLLEYKIADGWGPLCEFLGEKVPETEFPHVNDMTQFKNRCSNRNRRQMMNVALKLVTHISAVLVACWAAKIAFQRIFASKGAEFFFKIPSLPSFSSRPH